MVHSEISKKEIFPCLKYKHTGKACFNVSAVLFPSAGTTKPSSNLQLLQNESCSTDTFVDVFLGRIGVTVI